MFERLDGTVSLIEYSHSSIPHNTLYSLDFALQYVSKRIIIDNSRVVHLTPFLYDTQRSFNACKSALRNWRRHGSGSADINEEESGSVLYGRLNNTQVWQCVTLTDLQRILGELSVDVYSTTETRLCDVVLIEDLDEMFNIMTFKNPSQTRELILDTILLLRKISQLQGITCLLVQRRERAKFNVSHVSRLIRNMVDNCVHVRGKGTSEVHIESIYDDVKQ